MTFRTATAFGLLLLLPCVGTAQTPRKDGNWEVTMELLIDGTSAAPPRTTAQCITREEAETADQKALPQTGVAMPADCATTEHKVEGNKVSWAFKCETPHPMTGTGEIVYTDENSYTGSMTFVRDAHSMTIKYSGKRLGDCTK
jgi:hypothetical protein